MTYSCCKFAILSPMRMSTPFCSKSGTKSSSVSFAVAIGIFFGLNPLNLRTPRRTAKRFLADGELSSAVAALKEKGVLSGQRIERKDVGPAGLLYRAPGLRRLQRSSFASKSIVTIANDDCTGAKGASSTNGCSSSSSLLCRPTATSRLKPWC